jgi:hypothetical protein
MGVLKIAESVTGKIVLKTPAFPSLTSGTGSLQGVGASVTFAPSSCTFPYTSSTASFSAYIDWDNLFANAKSVKIRSLRYNVSDLASTIRFMCPDSDPTDKVTSWWWELYLLGHQGSPDGLGYLYKRDGFMLTGGQFPWATKHQDESGTGGLILSESTDFNIDHTPH